jgi:radical SAM/Cys-rich protein
VNRPLPQASPHDFQVALGRHSVDLSRLPLHTLQVNVTKLCNQACLHCHVDSSPKRTEHLSREGLERCLQLLEGHPEIEVLDLTGGAPELYHHFDEFVRRARALGKRVLVRHNLTVTFDGDPQTGASKEHLPEFFAEQGVEVVCSLPYYEEYFTDKQRGRGVFEKSIAGLRGLNAVGYGVADSGLELTLVYNPVGSFLPPPQEQLERDYRRALRERFQIEFTRLIAITNMPVNRFRQDLERRGKYEDYMQRLVAAFNPVAAEGVMCRGLLSIDHRGQAYDCDFNQMLDLPVSAGGGPLTIFDLDVARLADLPIRTESHCFGCTAGAGSSCGGATS